MSTSVLKRNNGTSASVEFVAPQVHLNDGVPISDEEFHLLADFLHGLIGISLTDRKRSLLQSRLSKRLRMLGFSTYVEYIEYLDSGKNKAELEEFINALTTNKTEFFRESDHFRILQDWVGKRGTSRLYLWSAACSTGEEPYTIAMVCDELSRKGQLSDFRILATDIDTECLEWAQQGLYSAQAITHIPPQHLQTHFHKQMQGKHKSYSASESLRQHIKFRQHNLIRPEQTLPLKFDVIFLRNVLIYFTPETVQLVIEKMWQHLKPKGLLFLGHSESLGAVRSRFRSIGTSVYEKES